MNRPIEFRAWIHAQKRMIDVYAVMPDGITENTLNNTGEQYFKKGEYELMQFTGLTDKNGVKIFDKCKFKYTAHEGYTYPDFIGEVVYDNEYACFGFYLNGIFYAFYDIDCIREDFLNYVEVIGS